MQAEQTRRPGRLGGGGTTVPVLLALSYVVSLPIIHARQGSETGVVISAVQTAKQSNPGRQKPSQARLAEAYAHLPLSFEANRGQAPTDVQFLARGKGFTVFLAGDEAVLALKTSGVRSQKPAVSRQLSVVSRQSSHAAENQQRATDRGPRTSTEDVPDSQPRVPNIEDRTPNTVLRMRILGADPAGAATADDRLPGEANYFIGNDPSHWRTHIPTYGQVAYRNIYPGVDLVYYGHAGQLEYDFRVNPGASPDAIRMALDGAAGARLTAEGDVALTVPGGEVRLQKPTAYQVDAAGEEHLVDAGFVLLDSESKVESQKSKNETRKSAIDNRQSTIAFRVGSYDRSRVLVIDPTLSYSTYLGGAGADSAFGIALDPNGNAYVTGQAYSTNFPVSAGALQSASAGAPDVLVTEFNTDGSALIYSTYLGGSGSDSGAAIAVDSTGAAYLTGNTNSTNFPTTTGVKQPSPGGGFDAFATKLAPGGASLVYSTYLGGKQDDYGYAITVDSKGDAFIAGSTASGNDFPLTKNALQPTFGGGTTDAFFTEYNPTATVGGYSTYLGGAGDDSASAIALDSSGNIYIAGQTSSTSGFPLGTAPYQKTLAGGTDAFVIELAAVNTSGVSSLLASTYLGGAGNDAANGIAVDSADSIYVTGNTNSTNFPTTNTAVQGVSGGGQDAFVTKLTAGAGTLSYSTYLGGSGSDSAAGIAVDSTGNALVTGNTQSTNFPVTGDALQAVCATGLTSNPNVPLASDESPAGCDDAFVASLDVTGAVLNYSTFFGGGQHDQGNAIAVDTAGNAYVAGVAQSTDLPTTAGVVQDTCTQQTVSPLCQNAFVIEIGAAAAAVQVAPIALPFGVEPLNLTTPAQTVTVTNNSGASLTFTAIAASTGFAVTAAGTTCSTGTPLANANSCTVAVTFTPTATGGVTGTLTLTDSAAASPQTISLSGAGVTSVVSVSPASLTFPGQVPTTSSSPQNVTLQNFGSAPLSITGIDFIGANSGDFSQTNTCGALPTTLAGEASCVISVTFTPAAAGAASATLTITDNATGSPQSVALSGSGVTSTLSLSAANLNFGSQVINTKSATQSVVVTNTGDTAVSITDVGISPPNVGFTTSKSPCPPSLGVGATCTISITFEPSTSGSSSATLSITDNAPDSPQTVALSGQGADFGITSSPSSTTVNPGQSATFTVSLMPLGGFNSQVALTCQGQPTYGSCSVSPSSVTPNGTAASTATVTITTLAPARLGPRPHRLLPPGAPLKLTVFKWPWSAWLLAALLGLGATALGKRRRSWAPMGATLAFALFWMGCSSTIPSGQAANGTPPGAYQISITGASNGLSHSVTVTVTVNP